MDHTGQGDSSWKIRMLLPARGGTHASQAKAAGSFASYCLFSAGWGEVEGRSLGLLCSQALVSARVLSCRCERGLPAVSTQGVAGR